MLPSRLNKAEKTSCGTKIEPLTLTLLPSTGKREVDQTDTVVLPGNDPNGAVWCRLIAGYRDWDGARTATRERGRYPETDVFAYGTLLCSLGRSRPSLPQSQQYVHRDQGDLPRGEEDGRLDDTPERHRQVFS